MPISMKKFAPEPIKKIIRPFLKYPPVCYTRGVLKLYFIKLFKAYPTGYREDTAPLIENFGRYEALFKDSEKNFEAILAPYVSEFKWFIGRIYNGAFESVDVELYYSMIRRYRPNLIIEVGSGHSTHFAMDAVKKNGTGHIISIDPEPRRKLPKGVEHIQSKVEDVDKNLFKRLVENDILFIDSSHTTKEAEYHVEEILPNLKKGVIIHHHDFLFPYAIYYHNDPTVFGEPDVLLNFYWRNAELWEVIVSASYVRYKNSELVRRLVNSYSWNPTRLPGSLWTRKIK